MLNLLDASEITYMMEAHNGLSARIVDEHDFDGVWASGLSIATSLGRRDCNEASWSQIVDVVETIVDATGRPVLVDGDSGFGSFNNVRVFVRKVCSRGAAGICLEDKTFPKSNSFLSTGDDLAPVPEFCGKIMAACDSRSSDDFAVVARVEALVAGRGLGEALDRADAYVSAGADAVLIHSRQPVADEVLAFGRAWCRRSPLVVVPTAYPSVRPDELAAAGVSTVVWANHNLRASVNAMRALCAEVSSRRSVLAQEGPIASVADVLELFDHDELIDAERRFGWIEPQRRAQSA